MVLWPPWFIHIELTELRTCKGLEVTKPHLLCKEIANSAFLYGNCYLSEHSLKPHLFGSFLGNSHLTSWRTARLIWIAWKKWWHQVSWFQRSRWDKNSPEVTGDLDKNWKHLKSLVQFSREGSHSFPNSYYFWVGGFRNMLGFCKGIFFCSLGGFSRSWTGSPRFGRGRGQRSASSNRCLGAEGFLHTPELCFFNAPQFGSSASWGEIYLSSRARFPSIPTSISLPFALVLKPWEFLVVRGEEKPEAKMPQDLGFWDETLSKSELMKGLLKVMTLWFRIFVIVWERVISLISGLASS